jgi:hypothetical protein
MRTGLTSATVLVLLWGVAVPHACAQKGMGDPTGVAQQSVKPESVSLSGKVLAVETGPCERGTGRGYIGTHFLLKTPKGKKLNIHLGPADAVDYVTDQLPVGKKVTVDAFRTAKMPENHYVAKSVTFGKTTIQLRDESLRPLWARSRTVLRGRGGPQRVPGRGRGRGWGRGWKQGPGYGRGWGRAWRWQGG